MIYILGIHWADYRREWFQNVRSDDKTERMLDAGSGDGWVKREFDRYNVPIEYFGIDLGIGDKKLEYKLSALADLHFIPFKNDSFDKVISNSVLEHVEDPTRVFQEMCRVLMPGGRLYLSVPFVFALHQEPYDNFRFTKHILETWARRNNLEIVRMWPMGGLFTVIRYIVSNYTLLDINDSPIWKFFFRPITWLVKQVDKTFGAPFFFILDKMDRNKKLCLGYFVVYEKKSDLIKDRTDDPYRCPCCQNDEADFKKSSASYVCNKCKKEYPVTNNIPDLALEDSIKPRSSRFSVVD